MESYTRVRLKGGHHKEAKTSVQMETHHCNIVIGLRGGDIKSNASGICNHVKATRCGIWLLRNICICIIYVVLYI
jgi:hypothetical protein